MAWVRSLISTGTGPLRYWNPGSPIPIWILSPAEMNPWLGLRSIAGGGGTLLG